MANFGPLLAQGVAIPYGQIGVAVWLLVALALFFDFLNGFHDAANSVATIVSTRVLSPSYAVIWAAFWNFIAFMVFHTTVAKTMGSGIIDTLIVDLGLIAAILLAACAWNLLTWYWALPTSSSHALVGGMAGAALAKAGADALVWEGIGKTLAFIVLAPVIGLLIGLVIAVAVYWIFRRSTPRRVDGVFRKGQLLSAALYSLGHGGNDAQKTMGIIWLLLAIGVAPLTAAGAGLEQADAQKAFMKEYEVGIGVVLACHAAMGLGTLCGGWRIVKTMGQKITHLRPVDGFSAETGAAATLVLTIFGGIPVSTTQTITGSIIGVGSLRRAMGVRWGMAGRVVWAWILTIPGSALFAALSWWLLRLLGWAG
jgi:PiT family inorganic phosphate transporter